MEANIRNATIAREAESNAVDTASRITVTAMAAVSGLIGLWALACLFAALISEGPAELISGFVTAVIGG